MKNKTLQTELVNLLSDRYSESESVLLNFAKGEDAYDPVNPQAVLFPNSNGWLFIKELLLIIINFNIFICSW